MTCASSDRRRPWIAGTVPVLAAALAVALAAPALACDKKCKTKSAPKRALTFAPRVTPSVAVAPRVAALLAGDRDDDRLNDRIDRLEARLSALMDRLEGLAVALEHGGRQRHDGRSEAHAVPHPSQVPHFAIAPIPPIPPVPPVPAFDFHFDFDESDRESIKEWKEEFQDHVQEWKEHQTEAMQEWRERLGDMREKHREQADQWKDWGREWKERSEEIAGRARERAREHAGRARERVERLRERAERRSSSRAPRADADGRKRVVYDITGNHADMFYHLLAPSNVKVIVSRNGNSIAVQGTRREHAVLDAFCQLAAWTDRDGVFEKMRDGDAESVTYHIGSRHAGALYEILAPNNVKVFVSREGGDAVSIRGTEREHKAITSFLKLIRFDGRVDHKAPKPKKERKSKKTKPEKKSRSSDRVRVVYDVTGDRADTLFEMLAPPYVKVIVSRAGDNIAVQGSRKEHAVVNAFCQLAGWIDRGQAFEKMREGDSNTKVYSVGEERAQMLYEILAPNTVKVVVTRASSDAVSVRGTDREHKVLKRFLKLLDWN